MRSARTNAGRPIVQEQVSSLRGRADCNAGEADQSPRGLGTWKRKAVGAVRSNSRGMLKTATRKSSPSADSADLRLWRIWFPDRMASFVARLGLGVDQAIEPAAFAAALLNSQLGFFIPSVLADAKRHQSNRAIDVRSAQSCTLEETERGGLGLAWSKAGARRAARIAAAVPAHLRRRARP